MKELFNTIESTAESWYADGKIWYILIGVILLFIYIIFRVFTI